jgi:hypothetical protein
MTINTTALKGYVLCFALVLASSLGLLFFGWVFNILDIIAIMLLISWSLALIVFIIGLSVPRIYRWLLFMGWNFPESPYI